MGISPTERRRGSRLIDTALAQAAELSATSQRDFSFDFGSLEEPDSWADRCYDKFGYRPISFSAPSATSQAPRVRARLLSTIVPGRPYTFDTETDYQEEYSRSLLALTHKKAGWDCFRHVEILAQGSVPLMPDIDDVPEFTMVHYPKPFLRAVWHEFMERGRVPNRSALEDLVTYTGLHMTSAAMARYMMHRTPIPAGRVLFLDASVPNAPDYLSITTMVGLTQTPDVTVDVLWPAHYLYSDWSGEPLTLYGRGFGYAKRISSSVRSVAPATAVDSRSGLPDLDQYDAVIIGGVTRNRELAAMVSAASTSARRLYLHGEDTPPDRAERRWLRNLVGECFVREIY